MKKIILSTLLNLFVISLYAQAGTEIDLKNFFRNPEKINLLLSPDGKYVSYRADYKGKMNIFVQTLAGGATTIVTRDTVRTISTYLWKGDRILYLQDGGGDENFQLFSVKANGTDLKSLTPFAGTRTDIIDDLHYVPGKGNEIVITNNKREKRSLDPYSINTETGEMKMIYQNDQNIIAWLVDKKGVIRVATKTDGVNFTYLYRKSDIDTFSVLLTTNFKERFQPKEFHSDNNTIIALSNIGRDKLALVLYNPDTRYEKLLYSSDKYDLTGIGYDQKTQMLLSARWTGARSEEHFFDEEWKKLLNSVRSKFRGYDVDISSLDDIGENAILWLSSDKVRARYYLYNLRSKKMRKVAEATPWLDEKSLASMQPVNYQSRDGFSIHGYLTLPIGSAAKKLPVIVFPHGGPWTRDVWGYNSEVQFLVNRGYAVLQMNYRGSTGYGKKFLEASYKQWGGKMQDDITDGVEWLIRRGIADKDKVAIYGGSYGGYAALSGITFTPDLYACAIDYVGISNLFTFIKAFPAYYKPYLDQVYEMIGHPKNDSMLLRSVSPLFHVDRIKVPVFVAQGANDPRVKKAESDQIVEALKNKGIEVEYMVKANEGHGFRNQDNKFDLYNAVEKFLERHLKKTKQSTGK